MQGTITARGISKNGKPTVHIDGKLYYPGKTNMASVQIGDHIEFDASAFGDRGNMWGINGWKLLEGVSKYPPSIPPLVPISAPMPSQTASEGIRDAERPCISNWGAELIRAGVIKDPADLGIWVNAAKLALRQ
jgi:hypothetical protein